MINLDHGILVETDKSDQDRYLRFKQITVLLKKCITPDLKVQKIL